jgi:hypothetical protein
MITFLFWNLDKKSLKSNIKNLAGNFDVDIFMFAECAISPDILLRTLNEDSVSYYYCPNIGCQKITIFTRFSSDLLKVKMETNRLTIRHLTLPGLRDILLAVMHFPDKSHWNDPSQTSECYRISDIIKKVEQEVSHSRTILVGDFNMNPFEHGLVSAIGFNAVMSRGTANKKNRTVQGEKYPFFYNPMWNYFGDETPGPPGTYYYNVSEHIGYFWNIFDQVLIRPELLPCIDKNFIQILDSDGTKSFLSSQGVPNSSIVSDHLPILFKLNL